MKSFFSFLFLFVFHEPWNHGTLRVCVFFFCFSVFLFCCVGYGGKSIVELAENHGPKFAESVHEVVQHANLIFVVVQTPHDPKFEGTTRLSAVKERADFNYSYLTSALKTLEDAIDKHNLELELHGVPKTEFTVIVISTVLPGKCVKN